MHLFYIMMAVIVSATDVDINWATVKVATSSLTQHFLH